MNKKQTLINDIKENCLIVDNTTSEMMSEIAGYKLKPCQEDEALNVIYKWAFEMLSVAQLEKLKRHSELLIDKAIADKNSAEVN